MFTKKSSLLKLLSTALISITLLSFVGCSFLTSVFGNDDENSNSSGTTENQNNQNTSSDENSNTSGDSNSDGDNDNTDYLSALKGTWTSEFSDFYTITSSSITYDDGYDSYEADWYGNIIEITDSYIYYKFVYVGSDVSNSDDLQGKYGATSYKNLTSTSCNFSDATAADYSKGNADTLDDAKSTLTVDNSYYSYYGTYTKSN